MHLIENPIVPLTTPIYGGMPCGAKIEIHGNAFCGVHNSFVVELMTPTGTIFHMSARFPENCLVMNSFDCGRWMSEERHSNPFCAGSHFHLKIKNHEGHFAVHVNGRHICHFHHRGNPHHISALTIRGDVAVSKIHFERFPHHNGGGIGIGGGVAPMYGAPVMMAPPAPVVVVEEGHHHHHHGLGHALEHIFDPHHHHHGHHGHHGHHHHGHHW